MAKVIGTSHGMRLVVQPDDGVRSVTALIEAAHRSVSIKMFTFTSPEILAALEAATARGVMVRVMLNPQRSSGSRANDETRERLMRSGIQCDWSSPGFAVTHEKSMVVDGQTTLIATFNFCEKYFTTTRDYGLVLQDEAVAAEVGACFEADLARLPFEPGPGSRLLWSNTSSRKVMCDFIDGAGKSLSVQHPKFVDMTVLDRLMAALDRGVAVKVLCGGKHGISDYDLLDTFSSLHMLRRAGARIHKQHGLRTHAKLILADDARALVGSMNIDRSAFDLRRELGIIVDTPEIVLGLKRVFDGDWDESKRYDAPDPLMAAAHVENDQPHDPDYVHE